MITKALVVMQTTWFVIQLVARAADRLAITELEIMTLAYGLMCASLYGLWWNKPYDVQKPILIHTQTKGSHLREQSIPTLSKEIMSVLLGSWMFELDGVIFGSESLFDDITSLSSWDNMVSLVLFLASATLFGCIHCIPWNFQFPTPLERLLWISSALTVAAMPCFLLFLLPLVSWLHDISPSYSNPDHPYLRPILQMVPYIGLLLFSVSLYAYFLARIIQPFVLLRHLSPSATQSISWVDFFPMSSF